MSFSIAVKNFSTVVSDAELSEKLGAFQTQVSRDFAPVWGVNAHLRIASKDEVLALGEWLIGVFDDADQAGALGYHDVTNVGDPLGKVFAKTTIDDGGLWTVTFSHELLEMLADPWINLTALDPQTSRLYAYEVCDAVEADNLGYEVNGVTVSDFVMPEFFRRDELRSGAFLSFNGKLTAPFSLDAGGYLSFIDMNDAPAGWQQVTADMAHSKTQAHAGTSRGARRRSYHNAKIMRESTAP